MATFAGRSIISMRDFSRDEILHVLDIAKLMDKHPEKFANALSGKIRDTVFEPSTRTRLSFELAMLRLGGKVMRYFCAPPRLDIHQKRRKSLADSIRIVGIVFGYNRHATSGRGSRGSQARLQKSLY